ncbi:hypothetical protein [Ferruginibacter sp. HRS2-29]|uniref:hypothetical protein n=1 Tax=Ferruginibacter sp. HRS2-29 TaxID=2487334 RepID=UPI0020CD7BB0|nr:hypothetical protein [Ferruginibacter sp. HRS2-29]MCP9752496.1 hypothetical protein [Ferruginibacter sp. HRS2-29]
MENTQNLLNNELQVDGNVRNHLNETAGWAKFLGIVGFIVSGLIGIGALFAGTFITTLSRSSTAYYGSSEMSAMSGMITVVYMILAVIGFFISLFTYKFGTKTKQALLTSDQDNLNAGMMNLKFIFRFYGIIMIIYIGILVLAVLASIFTAMSR